jgi:hypothetical protein
MTCWAKAMKNILFQGSLEQSPDYSSQEYSSFSQDVLPAHFIVILEDYSEE